MDMWYYIAMEKLPLMVLKHKDWIEKFLLTGDLYGSYREAKGVENPGNASNVIAHPDIQKYLQERSKVISDENSELVAKRICSDLGLGPKRVIQGLVEIAEDPESGASARVSAWVNVGRYMGMFIPGLNVKHSGQVTVNVQEVTYRDAEYTIKNSESDDTVPIPPEAVPDPGVSAVGDGEKKADSGVAQTVGQGQNLPECDGEDGVS